MQESHGKFFDAGVMVAYNSGWPIGGCLQAGLVTVGENVVREDEGPA